MNKDEFLKNIEDVLQTEELLSFETVLKDIDEWDSLSKMAIIAFLDKTFGVKANINDIDELKTISDIAKKAGIM